MRVTYTYNENNNVYTLREYNYTTKTFFEIIFKIGRIKSKTVETSTNPLLGEETVAPWYYEKMFNKLLYKYQFV